MSDFSHDSVMLAHLCCAMFSCVAEKGTVKALVRSTVCVDSALRGDLPLRAGYVPPAAHVRPVLGRAFQWGFGKWNVPDTERGLEVMLMRDD